MSEFTPLPVPHIPSNDELRHTALNEEQEAKRVEVLTHFDRDEYRLSSEENGELMDDEKIWLSNDCILRYLRGSKWAVSTAIKRIEDTLKWRREYGLYDGTISAEHVEPEAVTGKEILYGFDTKGRPAFYMIPSRQNTDEGTRQLQFVVWMLERSIDLMGPGVETLDLLINFADKAKNPSLGVARQTLNIIQSHYPERLGLALIINVPMLVNAFFKIIMPFVDPVTRNKVKFNPRVIEDGYFTADQLMAYGWGGSREFEYSHEKYWPELVRMSDERRAHIKARWRELGAKVGISEWEMKTGSTQAVIGTSIAEKLEEPTDVEVEPVGAYAQ